MTTHTAHRHDAIPELELQGHRSTSARRAIVGVLEQKREGFTVEEIGRELPDVSRATLFRTVKLLTQAGIICKLSLLDGAPRYSLSRVEHHHHTVCISCGIIGEFSATTVERLMRVVGNDIPGVIVGHRIELYVTCTDCLQNRLTEPPR